MAKFLIIEVESYEGEDTSVFVSGAVTQNSGNNDVLYCVGTMDNDGIVRFVDMGYRTPDEARKSWPNAEK